MKIERLQNFSLTAKIPDKDMTDKEWQEYFKALKISIEQSPHKRMRKSAPPTIINSYVADNQSSYHGETQWSIYRSYINSVLSVIRNGEYDYCYYIYQIADLLKYEHDKLRTLWLPEYRCFRVWLDAE